MSRNADSDFPNSDTFLRLDSKSRKRGSIPNEGLNSDIPNALLRARHLARQREFLPQLLHFFLKFRQSRLRRVYANAINNVARRDRRRFPPSSTQPRPWVPCRHHQRNFIDKDGNYGKNSLWRAKFAFNGRAG